MNHWLELLFKFPFLSPLPLKKVWSSVWADRGSGLMRHLLVFSPKDVTPPTTSQDVAPTDMSPPSLMCLPPCSARRWWQRSTSAFGAKSPVDFFVSRWTRNRNNFIKALIHFLLTMQHQKENQIFFPVSPFVIVLQLFFFLFNLMVTSAQFPTKWCIQAERNLVRISTAADIFITHFFEHGETVYFNLWFFEWKGLFFLSSTFKHSWRWPNIYISTSSCTKDVGIPCCLLKIPRNKIWKMFFYDLFICIWKRKNLSKVQFPRIFQNFNCTTFLDWKSWSTWIKKTSSNCSSQMQNSTHYWPQVQVSVLQNQ